MCELHGNLAIRRMMSARNDWNELKNPDQFSTSEVQDDMRLMELVSRRDESALRELYDRYSPIVFALCLRVIHDHQEAEGVTLDIFFELWEKPDRYNPIRSSPRTYILMLARSRAIDRRRALLVRQDRPAGHDGSLDMPAPIPATVVSDLRDELIQALGKLDPGQQQLIELSFFDGLSHGEIAEQTGVPLGTVKTRIRRGLATVRDALRNLRQDMTDT